MGEKDNHAFRINPTNGCRKQEGDGNGHRTPMGTKTGGRNTGKKQESRRVPKRLPQTDVSGTECGPDLSDYS